MLTIKETPLSIVQEAPQLPAFSVAVTPAPAVSLTIEELWRRLMRQKWLFLLTLLTVLVLTVWITWSLVPSYRAVSTIQIEKEGAQIVDFGALNTASPDLGEQDPFFRTQYEQLKSRRLAEQLIAKLDLRSRLFDKPVKPGPFDDLKERVKQFVKTYLPADKAAAKPPDYVDLFLKQLFIEPIEKTHLVKVFYESPDAGLAAEITNTLVDMFIHDTLTSESATDTYAQAFLEREMEKARQRLTNSENELVRYAREHNILEVNNSQGTQEKKLDDLTAALADAERRRVEAESQLGQARKHGNVAGVLGNPVVEALKRQLVDLEADYQKQSKLFKPAYPDMQQLARQIESVRGKLATEVANLKQSLDAEFVAASRLEGQISKDLNAYKGELVNLRDSGVEYNALKREAETSRKLYDDLLQRMNEVNVASGATSSNIRIIDPAKAPTETFRPKKALNLIVGSLIGLMLATGLALLRETLRRTVATGEELQTLSGLPVLGTIPHLRKMPEGTLALLAAREPNSPVAEAYRIAATNLKFVLPGGGPRVLLLTSVNPAEGKSTSSISLALSQAQMGAKVLLIDADLRRPTLDLKMDLPSHPGLNDYVQGRADLASITQHFSEVRKAYVISAGSLAADPLQVLSSPKMVELLELARKHFDMTIIDAPPVTGFADALVLSSLVDATVVVTDEDHMDRKRLLDTITHLQRVKKNVVGFLMVKAQHGVTDVRYYDRYRQARPAPVAAPTDNLYSGLNLAKARGG